MTKDEVTSVKDAVHKLQLFLLDGIKHEYQLSAAGSLISRSDYQDVVTERTIAKMCGYPLCVNSLPSERPRKGHYRVSLKEHKVYDLQETYMFCSSGCLINSRAFAASLQEERSSTLNQGKLNDVLKLFDGLGPESGLDVGKDGDLGMSKLKIQEKTDIEAGEVPLKEWIGPSNAIDGYVPRKDRNLKAQQSNNLKGGARREQLVAESKPQHAQPDFADIIFNDMNFTSTIITQDEYSVSKTGPAVKAKDSKGKLSSKGSNDQGNPMQMPAARLVNIEKTSSKKINKHQNVSATTENLDISQDPLGPSQTKSNRNATRAGDELWLAEKSAGGAPMLKSSLKTSDSKKATCSVTWADDSDGDGQNLCEYAESAGGANMLRSSLKTSDSKKATRSVTWADESDGDEQNLCEHAELETKKGAIVTSHSADREEDEESNRFVSAEACVRALYQAAEDVESGKSDVSNAVSEAGITILPSTPHGLDEALIQENGDMVDTDPLSLKWPPKPGVSNDDLFDSDNSWFDSPPEGFNLNLSPFSTMFMSLFAWLSSSSVAYIYGKDESFHEEYLSVNGREYPHKIILPDGRSSEIKQTLAGCLSRALPGLVAELRLPIPISTLEQGMGRLVDTMSFTDALPPFRMKQWQIIVLLFLDALSVTRIPALTQYMTGRRILLPKVLEGAQLSAEEYEIMKDLFIPLGRVPQFSTQSGG